MAINNYDDNFETYDDSDIAEANAQAAQENGGVPTIAFINKNTQTPVNLQPSSPPLNPKPSDMWIDTSIFPNVIYTWDGLQWNRASVLSASEVGAYTTAQVDDQMNNVQLDNTNLAGRVTTVETNTTPDAIVNTVTGSAAFKNKADATALGNYVLSSTLTTTMNNWNAQFSSGGGINLLKNSTGFGGLTNWQTISGAFSQYIGNDCIDSGSGFTATDGDIKQAISAVAGQLYTITCKVKKGTAGTGFLKISDGTTFQQVNMIATQSYNYTTIQISGFVPANNTLIIELNAAGVTGGIIFTALMVNIGTIGLQWCHALGELYNTNVQADINGLKVLSNVYDGYTIMSPSEFSGYFRNTQGIMQQVFTLNKDTTQVAKLAINDPTAPEFDMGSLKMLYVNGGGYDGWALIPTS